LPPPSLYEGRPIAPLVFVIGHEVDLVGIPVGIELEDFLVVVALAVDERVKNGAWRGAEKLAKDLGPVN